MSELLTASFAGVAVPESSLVERTIDYARQEYEPWLFNHAMRSWLFAVRFGQHRGISHDAEVVAVGTLLHDITLNDSFAGPRRFEVEAADQVMSFATEARVDERRARLIWDIVALNSTPSIAFFKQPEVALATAGIALDAVGVQYNELPTAEIDAILAEFPRMNLKDRFVKCFTHIAEACPETTYDNFVRDFGERFVPGYKAPSSVEWVTSAPFKE
jgi:hypothetical protein